MGYYVPRQVAVLSQGQFNIPVPLTLASTAPNLTWATVRSEAKVEFDSTRNAGAAAFDFDWSLAAPASMPVVFGMNVPDWQSARYLDLGRGSFRYLPAGSCSGTCMSTGLGIGASAPDTSFALGAVWSFNYTVRLMSRVAGLGTTEFLEVDLSPTSLEDTGTYHPADLGVAAAVPTDLQLLQAFNTQPGYTFGFTTNDTNFQTRSFGYSPAAVALDAGTQGKLSVRLTSSFRWSSVLWETVTFMGLGGNFSVREYLDLRFGSIQIDVGSWSGI